MVMDRLWSLTPGCKFTSWLYDLQQIILSAALSSPIKSGDQKVFDTVVKVTSLTCIKPPAQSLHCKHCISVSWFQDYYDYVNDNCDLYNRMNLSLHIMYEVFPNFHHLACCVMIVFNLFFFPTRLSVLFCVTTLYYQLPANSWTMVGAQ